MILTIKKLVNLVHSPMERPAGHLGGLDALRFVSVYCILLSHSGYRVFSGYGVPILMALSGFLITRQLLGVFNRTRKIYPERFLVGRMLRIAPAYLVFVAVTFLAYSITGNTWPSDYIWYSLTHTINYYNATHNHPSLPMAHVWTLSVLEQFYLIWPLIFCLFVSSSKRINIIAALIFVALCWRLLAYTVIFPDNISWIYNALDCRLDSILIGCITAVWMDQRPDRITRMDLPTPVLLLVVIASLTYIAYSNDYKPWHYSFGYLFEAAAAMILIISLSRISLRGGFKWIDSMAFSWLGKISYSLFLYHGLAIGVGLKLFDDPYLSLITATIIGIITSAGSYYLVETPVLNLRGKIRKRWQTQ